MMLLRYWLLAVAIVLNCSCLLNGSSETAKSPLRESELLELRDMTIEMFNHAYGSYLNNAFPSDELCPISCKPREGRLRGDMDDCLGLFSLTMLDSLDTLLLMRQTDKFKDAVRALRGEDGQLGLNFDRDVNVSVFEVNIRALGGLVSAHQLASHVLRVPEEYDGVFLLERAVDLANRIMPAFNTPTGIPQHRVNLRHGRIAGEVKHTCPAAGGSFLVEMGVLSRLTGNYSYVQVALAATNALWARRSKLDLLGALIDTESGHWVQRHSGIGAGADSFYETLLKGSIVLDDPSLLAAWEKSYQAVMIHNPRIIVPPPTTRKRKPRDRKKGRDKEKEKEMEMEKKKKKSENDSILKAAEENLWHMEVLMDEGKQGEAFGSTVSALQAFFPGLQVLAGHIAAAKAFFKPFANMWHRCCF